jgi:hypothetical protein
MDDIEKTNKISKLYTNLTYIDDYSSSVILFSFITLVLILICVYCYVMIRAESIKRDWINQRCKPNVIPFAGFINKPDNMSATEYTSENFRYCTQSILKNVSNAAVSPYTDIISTLTNLSGEFTESMNDARQISSKIRDNMAGTTSVVYEKVQSAITPMQPLFDAVKTFFAKLNGVMTTFLYTINGLNMTLKSLMGSIAELCVDALIAMAAAILVLWAIAVWVWPVAIPAGIATALYAFLASMLVPLLLFMKSATAVQPSVCFDKSTEIVMNDGTTTKMVDIQVGDVLSDSNVVTAKLKLSATGAQMYNLNGVIVSESHTVKHDDKWILVSKHPEAQKVYSYAEPYIYCLNTSSKKIVINDACFADWDEIYNDEHIDSLKKNAGLNSSIHESMDSGFTGNTKIQLQDGTFKPISDIQIGDILLQGESVYGLVEIRGDDINQYKYNFGNDAFFVGGPNLTICDPNIECITTMNLDETKKVLNSEYKQYVLYHLLTDKQQFNCCGVCFYHYNASLDLFLDTTRENLLSMKYV